MRVLVALIAFVAVAALNLLWWWWPNRPVEIAGWTNSPLQSVSFAPYRPGQSPLTRTFPTPDQIEEDLRRLQGKVRAVRTYSAGENLETVPQRAGKYGLKVWHGAWLNDNDKENLEQVNLLIDHANKYKDTVERVIVGNEVLLRKELTANQLRRYIRQVKQRVSPAGDLRRRLGILDAQPVAGRRGRLHHHPHPAVLGGRADRPRSPRARRQAEHREAHRRHLQEGAGALSRQEDRDRRDRLAERRPHALRRAARPGRAGALLLDLPLASPTARSSTTTSSKPSTSTGRRARRAPSARPGACSTRSATTSSSSASRCPPSRTGAIAVRPVDAGWRPDAAGGFVGNAPTVARQGDRDLRRLRPARRDLLRAGDLDRPVAHLLLREDGRRGVLGGAARRCSATPCCAASPTA